MIDRQIIGNYKLQKSNQIAFDLLNNSSRGLGDEYTEDDKKRFLSELELKISKMDGDPLELRSIFLGIYARPFKNKLSIDQI
jgi:hypothetical protein